MTSGKQVEAGREAVIAVERAWNRAAREWDADALSSLYTPDALFFGGRAGHFVGADAIRTYFASYEGTILSATLQLTELQIMELAPCCFLAQGFADFSFLLMGDESTRSHLRATLVLVQPGVVWRICQHHFSASPMEPPLGRSS